MQERLKKVSKALGLSLNQMSKELGYAPGYVSQMVSGRRNINSRIAQFLELTYNVDRRWFETGEGEMFKTVPEPEPEPEKTFDPVAMEESVALFVAGASKLPREIQVMLARVGLAMCEQLDLSPPTPGPDKRTNKNVTR